MAGNDRLMERAQGGGSTAVANLTPQDRAMKLAAAVLGPVDGSFQRLLTKALPRGADDVRFKAAILAAYRQTPDLADCAPETQKLAMLKAAATGLELGDEVFLIPRWNGKTQQKEAGAQIGYQGWAQLLRRSGLVKNVVARPVREGDDFDIDYGAGHVHHRPMLRGKPGATTGYYASIELTSGSRLVYYMSREEVEEHRLRYAPNAKGGGKVTTPAWASEYDAMACKTVLLQCKRFAPRSRDMFLAEHCDKGTPMKAEEREDGLVLTPDTRGWQDGAEADEAPAGEGSDAAEAPSEPGAGG